MLLEHLINLLNFYVFFSTSKIFGGLPLKQLDENANILAINHQLWLLDMKRGDIVNISGRHQMSGSV